MSKITDGRLGGPERVNTQKVQKQQIWILCAVHSD